ncbi:MAG TPA: homocysteine S-methyltransferase family protein, partial [Chloroflexota bacterium]
MGTQIQSKGLTAEDFGGAEFEGCNEYLNITRPDVILGIHRDYLRAGADVVETNTFGSTALVLGEYPPLNERAYEITRRGAELARQAADEFASPEKPRFVAGSMGPTTRAISVTGGATFEQLVGYYREQARGLVDGGVDYLLLETSQDTRNVKAGLIGIDDLFRETGRTIPVAVSGTIEPMGTMLAGQTVEALVTSLEHVDLLYVGLNCATGPDFMTDHIRAAAEMAAVPVACVPNAGLPDENGHYLETPQMIAHTLERFVEHGWLNLVGGCCGTTPAHIAALAEMARGKQPRVPVAPQRLFLSGLDNLEVEDSNRPVIVGERTNSIGSRLFKKLIADEKFEEASEIGRAQVKNGAQVIDVCLANPDRNEMSDMERFMSQVIKKVKVPLMIDSTDPAVIERALSFSQGKAIINSINLEDGEERFERVVPVAKRYGAAFVVGCIDEQGMAVTAQRKVEVAVRSHDLLVQRYGVRPTDMIFDPLTFPCATGDQQYVGSAAQTVEGIRLIKERLPGVRTILGISNVSFGLPPAGREVMNSVFLYHCTQAGLDLAIVNAEKLERFASIPEEEVRMAEDVLFRPSDETIAAFTAHFRGSEGRVKKVVSQLSLDERLANYIVEGTKEGLIPDLEAKLREAP